MAQYNLWLDFWYRIGIPYIVATSESFDEVVEAKGCLSSKLNPSIPYKLGDPSLNKEVEHPEALRKPHKDSYQK